MQRAIHRFFSDSSGKIVVYQRPNALLWTWIVCFILSWLIKHGTAHAAISLIGSVALIGWSLLEIFKGTSPFRRVLGVIILALSLLSILRRLVN